MPGKRGPGRTTRSVSLSLAEDKIFVKEAKRRGMTVSTLIVRTALDSIQDADQMNLFFEDPAVRKIFTEALTKPGAMKKIFAAMGQDEFPEGVTQTTLDSILKR